MQPAMNRMKGSQGATLQRAGLRDVEESSVAKI